MGNAPEWEMLRLGASRIPAQMELREPVAKGSSCSIRWGPRREGSVADAGVAHSLPPPSITDSESEPSSI
jgi:hypothetical protein